MVSWRKWIPPHDRDRARGERSWTLHQIALVLYAVCGLLGFSEGVFPSHNVGWGSIRVNRGVMKGIIGGKCKVAPVSSFPQTDCVLNGIY